MEWKQSKRWLKWSIPLGLAIVLAACGGKSDDKKNDASPSPSASASASASPSASPSPSPSPSPSASPSESAGALKEGYILYDNAEYKIRMQYPKDWTVQDNIPGVAAAFVSPLENDKDTFQENVNLIVQDLGGQEITLEQYADASKQQLQQLITDFKLISSGTSTEDGVNYMEYTGKQGKLSLYWEQATVFDSGKAYVITYTATPDTVDKYQDAVAEMVETLESYK